MVRTHESPLPEESFDGEDNGVGRASPLRRQSQFRKLRRLLPYVMALVLTVFAVRATSEASRAFSGFSQLGKDAAELAIGDIEAPAAVAQRHRRLLVGSGARSLEASDIVALHVTLQTLAVAAAQARDRFATLGEPSLVAAAGAVASESDDLAVALEGGGR